jgi:hypothetical protein
MTLSACEQLLKDAMGLDVASIGASAIERAVRHRQHACQLPDVNAYWEHLRRSQTELQELIDAVVVPETWFFRDRESFAALARVVRDELLPASVGCTSDRGTSVPPRAADIFWLNPCAGRSSFSRGTSCLLTSFLARRATMSSSAAMC